MRSFRIIDCPQRSKEWFSARCGRLTGSVAGDIVATLKNGGEPAARRDLRTKLALERIVGRSLEDDYESADMRRGRELEPEAVCAYEVATGNLVQKTGFLSHTELPIGSSLDGHIGDFDGILEVKAPRPANHLKYIRAGGLPAEHRYQIVHNLLVSGAYYADFVSFCPDFPEPLQLYRVRVDRDEPEIAAYLLLVRLFLQEVTKEWAEIQALAGVAA